MSDGTDSLPLFNILACSSADGFGFPNPKHDTTGDSSERQVTMETSSHELVRVPIHEMVWPSHFDFFDVFGLKDRSAIIGDHHLYAKISTHLLRGGHLATFP